jgi:hypothetical protein
LPNAAISSGAANKNRCAVERYMTPGQQNENIDDKKVSSLSEDGLENAGRRRFARSGLAASGIIATLTSRPVLGAVCKSPSGFLSGNLSKPDECTTLGGVSPGYWKNKTDWPVSPGLKFCKVFTATSGPFSTVTLVALLDPQEYDKYGLGRHLVAAYLNYMSGRTPFLKLETLQAMWNEIRLKGYFTPTAGVTWTPDQVVSYISKTFH